ncbi:Ras-related protein Rab-21 [Tritrichomonas foetus]|uniref:Ras-related protein Rab-21 n=1 Tax=Tritrichomonas foetus TaxID=1144522 RepID=A0A1J4J9Z7_9EUKA|nr:Ras-related protein Rab-21 [Tritrichomonas foetus]|eukprot:OHS94076.1 Ras-related protein Rab-21 [Tritrichomonas foetus]
MRTLLDEKSGAKVVLLGNSGAGKTSILQSQLQNLSNISIQPTIGCQFHEVPININNETVALKVWDTAGQEVYRSIVPVYVRDAAAAILVYDITDLSSFQSLDQWRSLLLEEQTGNVALHVVCNKIDLVDDAKVDEKVALQFADKIGASFFKVSAIEGKGISELFTEVAKSINNDAFCRAKKVHINDNEGSGCC